MKIRNFNFQYLEGLLRWVTGKIEAEPLDMRSQAIEAEPLDMRSQAIEAEPLDMRSQAEPGNE